MLNNLCVTLALNPERMVNASHTLDHFDSSSSEVFKINTWMFWVSRVCDVVDMHRQDGILPSIVEYCIPLSKLLG